MRDYPATQTIYPIVAKLIVVAYRSEAVKSLPILSLPILESNKVTLEKPLRRLYMSCVLRVPVEKFAP